MSDPRYTDPRLSDPVVRRDENVGGMWGWIAGIAVLVLIGFILVAGWSSSGTNTASTAAPPATTASTPMRNVTPPSTTGSGSMSPLPASPAPKPAIPAPANSGTQ